MQRFTLFLLLAFACLGLAPSTASAQSASASSRGLAGDIADLDHLLSRATPGNPDIFVGDQGLKVAALRHYRDQLAARLSGRLSPHSAFEPAFNKWTNGIVPYAFDPNVPTDRTALLLKACQDWANVADLHFVPRGNQPNYVVFTNSKNGNDSYVGMIGGGQIINIQDYQEFLICHEIGHALGLEHEQSRSDRDQYVTIVPANIPADKLSNFDKIPGTLNQGPYDFDSIMHYFLTAFSINFVSPTITVNPPYDQIWNNSNVGTETHLSQADKAGMAAIYGPVQSPRTETTTTLTASANPSVFGQAVTFTAQISGSGPTGTVTFANGFAPLGTSTVGSDGSAALTVSTLKAGTHTITATYGGDATYDTSVGTLTLAVQTHASSQYVSPLGRDSNPGSLQFPKKTIQSAILASLDGDTVVVEDGTYTGPGNVDLDFSGRSLTLTSQNGAGKTVIDCQGSGSNPHRAFYLHSGEVNAVLNGLTIQNGYESSSGGGLFLSGVSATVQNCVFAKNVAAQGGAVFNYSDSVVTLVNCTFTTNAANIGGAVYNYVNSAVTLTNDILYGDSGGEIYGPTSQVTFCDVLGGFKPVSTGGDPVFTLGNFNLDPKFINPAGGDLHLRPGSPCLGKGTATGAPTQDADNKSRLSPPSVGAYESQTVSAHLLWTNSSGQVAVWNLTDPSPAATPKLYGPFPGWTAKAISQGPDGKGRILWTNTDGHSALWNLSDAVPSNTAAIYGPYPGWTATALTVGPDNAAHLLWDNVSGQVALWNTTDPSPAATAALYGPYSGWTGTAISIGANNQERLLWNNTSGQVAVWNLADANPAATYALYGPYSGWTAKTISVGVDNAAHLLWDNVSGQVAVWNLNDPNPVATPFVGGPYSGWAGQDLSVGADNKGQLLWDNSSGQSALWNLGDASPISTSLLYGPFGGWTAVSIAASR